MANYQIRPLDRIDRNWVARLLDEHWGSTRIVSRGRIQYAHTLPGFVIYPAENGAETPDQAAEDPAPPPPPTPLKQEDVAGFVTFNIEGLDCEIVTLNSFREGIGVGSALIDAVKQAAEAEGCRRVWLVTSNDNMKALRYYQRRGFELVAVHRGALIEARKLKPEIPLTGQDDIPIRDEIEMEIPL